VQILFYTKDSPQSFAEGLGTFPDAPKKCPHKNCHIPVKMRKHGFYKRYIINDSFTGVIRIRRYICPMCGRTVSMLPSFCLPYMQYGVTVVIFALWAAMECNSVKYAGTRWSGRPQTLTRRHIYHYRNRIIRNRGHIQFGLNIISPGFIELKQITGDLDWTREFLKVVNDTNPPQFNVKYHSLTGTSFMSLHNTVA